MKKYDHSHFYFLYQKSKTLLVKKNYTFIYYDEDAFSYHLWDNE